MTRLCRFISRFVPLWSIVAACTVAGASAATPAIQFKNITTQAGIRFVHTDGSCGKRYIVETVTAGLGIIDYDADGYPDILFLNGEPLPGAPKPSPLPTSALYHNNRDGTFTDVTAGSGLDVPAYAMGCAVADYDNDGKEDFFLTCFGKHRLFRNVGNGHFQDVTERAGVGDASGPGFIGAGCIWLDYDRDGFVDLFVGNYLEFDISRHQPLLKANLPSYIGPREYPAVPNRLYRNNGDGTFRNTSDSSGIGKYKGYAMGLVSADFDADGWPDIYVGNDVMENYLFHNKRNGEFEEIGIPAGCAVDQYGDPQGTMGVNTGDYDGDGRFDILVTDYQNQVNTLYRNLGNLQFQDVTVETAAGIDSRPLVTWGCGLVDFANDGVPEIFTAAGHLQDTIEQLDGSSTYKQRSLLLERSNGRFVNVTRNSGDLNQLVESSRAAVFPDLNNDGKLDIVILNARSRAAVFLNTTAPSNHWLTLKLEGTRSNRSAVGTLARVTAGGVTRLDEVRAGRSYQSGDDLRLHFGLSTNSVVDKLELFWPSGASNAWTRVAADRILRIKEGDSALSDLSTK